MLRVYTLWKSHVYVGYFLVLVTVISHTLVVVFATIAYVKLYRTYASNKYLW
jgi:hypothetical protein